MANHDKIIVDNLLTRKVAALIATGSSLRDVAQEVGYSYEFVRRIVNRPDTKDMIKEIGESAITQAKIVIKSRVANLAQKILKVVEAKLDEGDLDAVKVGLKILGFSELEKVENQGNNNLTVILPGKPEPTIIDAEVTDIPDDAKN